LTLKLGRRIKKGRCEASGCKFQKPTSEKGDQERKKAGSKNKGRKQKALACKRKSIRSRKIKKELPAFFGLLAVGEGESYEAGEGAEKL